MMVKRLKAGTRVSLRHAGAYHTGIVVGCDRLGSHPDEHRYTVRIEREGGRLGAPVRGCVVYQVTPSAGNWEEVER